MTVEFEFVRSKLINKELCFLRVGYGSTLRIGLGEKTYYQSPKLKGKYFPEWDFYNHNCTWRVREGEQILCGYYDDEEFASDTLKLVKPQLLKEIIQVNRFDLMLVFENQLIIEYFYQSIEEPILDILNRNANICFEITMSGWEQVDPKKPKHVITEIETALSTLSRDCDDRWSKLIPQNVSEKECNECFYFRGLNGHFHFWDYGICSNKESVFDGKLVSVKSGCNRNTQLKDLLPPFEAKGDIT